MTLVGCPPSDPRGEHKLVQWLKIRTKFLAQRPCFALLDSFYIVGVFTGNKAGEPTFVGLASKLKWL